MSSGELIRLNDRIHGDRIVWVFGGVREGLDQKLKKVGTFYRNGYAYIDKPVRQAHPSRAAEGVRQPVYTKIACEEARYEADEIVKKKLKKPIGSHRGWNGSLRGDASCTISIPSQNIPVR